jgi:hypothetical protein
MSVPYPQVANDDWIPERAQLCIHTVQHHTEQCAECSILGETWDIRGGQPLYYVDTEVL